MSINTLHKGNDDDNDYDDDDNNNNYMFKCLAFILRIVQGCIPNLDPDTLCNLSY